MDSCSKSNHTPYLASDRKCLVLGGSGFLGSHLTEALLERGFSVRVLDRPRPPGSIPLNPRIDWVEGDFLHQEQIAEALSGCDTVFHLISTTLPKASNDDPTFDVRTNILGTVQLLQAASKCAVRKVIFVSSGGTVYGVPRSIPIPESHPTDPICSYGIGKLTVEKYLHMYHSLHGLEYCVLRVANVFGERQSVSSGQGAVSVFLNRALHRRPIEIWGDGMVVRDFVYVEDVVDALVRAMSHSGDVRIFNIGSGEGKTLNNIVQAVEKLLSRRIEIRYLAPRKFDVPSNVLNIDRARQVLGWTPTTPFEDGLLRTHNWLVKDQPGQ